MKNVGKIHMKLQVCPNNEKFNVRIVPIAKPGMNSLQPSVPRFTEYAEMQTVVVTGIP